MFRLNQLRPRRLLVAASLAAIAVQGMAVPALADSSTVVKVNGTDLFCPFDTADAGGTLFAITRDRTDGAGLRLRRPVHRAGRSRGVGARRWQGQSRAHADRLPRFMGHVRRRHRRGGRHCHRRRDLHRHRRVPGSAHLPTRCPEGDLRGPPRRRNAHRDDFCRDLRIRPRGVRGRHPGPDGPGPPPEGPKAGGPAPANDSPAGAITLSAGEKVQQWTGGAALASEAPCILGSGDDEFEFALGRTVWFSVPGTGNPITIDPRGSNFDTVVAAYASTAEGLTQVGCIDDDDVGQTQGSLTFDTTAGTTYLVQVGGVVGQFDGDPEDPQWGRLRLRVS